MSAVTELYDELAGDGDAVFLFSPSESLLAKVAEATDPPVVVVAADGSVSVEVVVTLPLKFDDVAERIRSGIEGAFDLGIVAEGDTVCCVASVFGGDADATIRVRVGEQMRSGVYDLSVNSRADPGVIRDVFEVAVELRRKDGRANLSVRCSSPAMPTQSWIRRGRCRTIHSARVTSSSATHS